MATADDLRPLGGASAAVLRATAQLAGAGSRRLLALSAQHEAAALEGARERGRPSVCRLEALLDRALDQSTAEAEEVLLESLVRGEEYEVLLAEPDVLDAIRRAGRGPVGPRIRRGGVELSDLGKDLWSARPAAGRTG